VTSIYMPLTDDALEKWFDTLTRVQLFMLASGDAVGFCQSMRGTTGDISLSLRIYEQLREVLL